ncbi:HugZ family protein [Ningiella sp. W23]|uniref:HugZ family pyridoxamine 5'-phosphate oxidase n=1 Tax=Ningiella sp. W23 TaxID=3023715 RepID=UPI0037572844
MSNKQQHILDARLLLRQEHSGVLATNSLSVKGFPFGSVVPFLMTEDGDLVLYASDIAQHSRNMKADAKVSLCVYDHAKDDSQASARVTVLAHAQADVVSESLKKLYFSLFEQAKSYVKAHDFRFYLLKTERVRYIGGFGEIYWFSRNDWTARLAKLSEQSEGVISHMHEDHGDALAEIVTAFTQHRAQENEVEMLSCFAEGFHVRYKGQVLYISYKQAVNAQYDVRKAMVDLTKTARISLAMT